MGQQRADAVSAVVISYFPGGVLARCLDALRLQPGVREIILVDNGNPAGAIDAAIGPGEDGPPLRVFSGHGKIGFAAACNLGVRAATGDLLLFVNPDAILPPGGAERLAADGAARERPWLMGANIIDPDDAEQRGSRRATLTPWRAFVEATSLYRFAPRHPYFRRFNLHGDPCPDLLCNRSIHRTYRRLSTEASGMSFSDSHLPLFSPDLRNHRRTAMRMRILAVPAIVSLALLTLGAQAPAQAQYKPKFKTSLVVQPTGPWGEAATKFADLLKERTQGRTNVKNYFAGQLFAGKQTNEFTLLNQGVADFALGSTINWSPQVKELNLFAMPFMYPSYKALDAVEAGDPGQRLWKLIEAKGVISRSSMSALQSGKGNSIAGTITDAPRNPPHHRPL